MPSTKESNLCTVMKGIAIAGIVMHNYLHLVGYASENEHYFIFEKGVYFLTSLVNNSLPHIVGDIFSFIGWIGICAFIFLSGYGLERKYGSSEIVVSNFVWSHWKKLFGLMLAGVIFFIIYKWNDGKGLEYIVSLTMCGNAIWHYGLPCGVYWYFGLAFELYLFWLIIRRLNTKGLLIVLLLLLLVQFPISNSREIITYKYNASGWAQVMVFGMIAARRQWITRLQVNWKTSLAIAVVGCVAVIACNFNKHTWLLLLPFLAVVTIWALAELIMKWSVSKQVGLWLGRLSAFFFAMHPIVREVIITETPDEMNRAVRFAIYLGCTVLLTILFAKVYRKITSSSFRYSNAR